MPREKSPQTKLLERVKNDFAFHPATTTTGPQHDAVRADFARLAQKVAKTLPEGREKSLVLTKLEEAMFFANAAIARNPQQDDASSDAPAPEPKKRTAKRAPAKKSARRPRRPEPTV